MRAKARRAAAAVLTVLFVFVCAALLALPQWLDKPLLFCGAQRYTFYAQSASSQAQIVTAEPQEAAYVRRTIRNYTGESAYYAAAEDAFSQAEAYGAHLVLVQRSADVCDYYYYSPRLAGGVWVAGERINLHVAVRGEGANVGYPLVFGGY